jgi:hypothetical protein
MRYTRIREVLDAHGHLQATAGAEPAPDCRMIPKVEFGAKAFLSAAKERDDVVRPDPQLTEPR